MKALGSLNLIFVLSCIGSKLFDLKASGTLKKRIQNELIVRNSRLSHKNVLKNTLLHKSIFNLYEKFQDSIQALISRQIR